MKKRTIIAAGVIFAGAFLFGVAGYVLSTPVMEYFGAPRTTVINRTGEPIRDISVILGSTETEMKSLKENQFRTVKIRKNFPESATTIRWSDSGGSHEARADDYMEDYGFYHSTIILSEDRQAVVIWEAR
jgi:hypothetical protein